MNSHYLYLQVRFVRNITTWREMKPGFYHGHVAYLDFSKYGSSFPVRPVILINMSSTQLGQQTKGGHVLIASLCFSVGLIASLFLPCAVIVMV